METEYHLNETKTQTVKMEKQKFYAICVFTSAIG